MCSTGTPRLCRVWVFGSAHNRGGAGGRSKCDMGSHSSGASSIICATLLFVAFLRRARTGAAHTPAHRAAPRLLCWFLELEKSDRLDDASRPQVRGRVSLKHMWMLAHNLRMRFKQVGPIHAVFQLPKYYLMFELAGNLPRISTSRWCDQATTTGRRCTARHFLDIRRSWR